MKLLVCGEGPNDVGKDPSEPHEGTLQALLSRLLERDDLEFERMHIAHLRPRGKKNLRKRKLELALKEVSYKKCHGLVYVVDQDGDEKRLEKLKKDRTALAPETPNALGVAIKTIESWLLSDETAVKEAFNAASPATSKSPETIADAKSELREWLHEVERYDYSSAYQELARFIRIDILRRRCPRGFGVFADEVKSVFGD